MENHPPAGADYRFLIMACAGTIPADHLGDCAPTCDGERRGVVAIKAWHGRFPFDRECVPLTINPAPDQTKYLSHAVHVTVDSVSDISDHSWNPYVDPAVPYPTSDHAELHDVRTAICLVNRYSGVRTFPSCVETRTQVEGDGSASLIFGDLSLGGGAIWSWKDMMSYLDAQCGIISRTGAWFPVASGQAPPGGCSVTYPTNLAPCGTPAEISAQFSFHNESHTSTPAPNDEGYVTTADEVSDQVCTCTLSGTKIELEITSTVSRSTTGYLMTGGSFPHVIPEYPTSTSYEATGRVLVIIELGVPYTNAELNADVDDLLSRRALTDDVYVPWQSGVDYPLIVRDEYAPTTPVYARSLFDAGYFAAADPDPDLIPPYPGHAARELCELFDPRCVDSGPCPSGAVLNGAGAVTLTYAPLTWRNAHPAGAFKQYGHAYGMASHRLVACKYAEIIPKTRPAHSWYRPAGAVDRALKDREGHARYATVWPIVGHLVVLGASNTSPIVITVADVHGLRDGDRVDLAGALGNTAANVTHLVIGNVAGTTFELTGVAGNGAWTHGGTVTNPAAYGPPAEVWNDATPKGDFLTIFYDYNVRDFRYNPAVREYNGCYIRRDITALTVTQHTLAPTGRTTIVSISPAGNEVWGAAYHAVVRPFGASALPLVCDERFSISHVYSTWCGQIQQRMLDPINGITAMPWGDGEAVGELHWVESRVTVPAGAPALPAVHGGHCGDFGLGGDHSLVPCTFLHILTIPEITALGDAQVGGVCPVATGKLVGPLYWCCDRIPDALVLPEPEITVQAVCSPLSDIG